MASSAWAQASLPCRSCSVWWICGRLRWRPVSFCCHCRLWWAGSTAGISVRVCFALRWQLAPHPHTPPARPVLWGIMAGGLVGFVQALSGHVCPACHWDKDKIRANPRLLFVIISCPILYCSAVRAVYGRGHAHLSACGSGLRYRACLCLSRGTAYRRCQLSASSGGGHRPVRAFPC